MRYFPLHPGKRASPMVFQSVAMRRHEIALSPVKTVAKGTPIFHLSWPCVYHRGPNETLGEVRSILERTSTLRSLYKHSIILGDSRATLSSGDQSSGAIRSGHSSTEIGRRIMNLTRVSGSSPADMYPRLDVLRRPIHHCMSTLFQVLPGIELSVAKNWRQ